MKKLLVTALLLLVTLSSHADSIKCYAGGKIIYYRNVSDVTYTGEMFIFKEIGSDRIIFFSGDCIVKLNA